MLALVRLTLYIEVETGFTIEVSHLKKDSSSPTKNGVSPFLHLPTWSRKFGSIDFFSKNWIFLGEDKKNISDLLHHCNLLLKTKVVSSNLNLNLAMIAAPKTLILEFQIIRQ